MDKQKVKNAPSQIVIPLLYLLIYSFGAVTTANAQEYDRWRLEKLPNVERGTGSRLAPVRDRECRYCKDNEANIKIKYLKRVLSEKGSTSYQKEIESMIFTNSEVVNSCWKNANGKGLEFFFTVNESGQARDFAWFPKHKVGKCVKRHISKIEFPSLDKPHHAWLVASETTR